MSPRVVRKTGVTITTATDQRGDPEATWTFEFSSDGTGRITTEFVGPRGGIHDHDGWLNKDDVQALAEAIAAAKG